MYFVSYSHLIILTSGQTLLVTVALKKFWGLNCPSEIDNCRALPARGVGPTAPWRLAHHGHAAAAYLVSSTRPSLRRDAIARPRSLPAARPPLALPTVSLPYSHLLRDQQPSPPWKEGRIPAGAAVPAPQEPAASTAPSAAGSWAGHSSSPLRIKGASLLRPLSISSLIELHPFFFLFF